MSVDRNPRWWPLVLIAAGAGGGLLRYRIGEFRDAQDQVIWAIVTVVLTVMALLIWLLCFSRLTWTRRIVGLLGLLLSLGSTWFLFPIVGVTGDLVPIVRFRWSEAAGTRLDKTLTAGNLLIRDYPQFQGPGRDAVVSDLRLATDWSSRPPRLLWHRPVGPGWSAFAVSGMTAVTQEQHGDQEAIIAYHLLSGDILWRHDIPARYSNPIAGTGPRATPTVSGDRVYAMGARGTLTSLDLADGRPFWSRNVVEESGGRNPVWGNSGSPLVTGDLVIVSAGGEDNRSLVALDRFSGEIVWHHGRSRSGYSSPQLRKLAGIDQILIFNHDSVAGHAAVDGSLLWQTPWSRDRPNVSQPLPLPGDRVLVSSGYGVGAVLYQVSRKGQDWSLDQIWKTIRLKSKFANLIYFNGYIYGLDDGIMVCIDPADGSRRWKRGRYGHGQMILVEDLLLLLSEKGELILIRPNPDSLQELARLPVLEGKTWNPPALAGQLLLVRNERQAACYQLPLAD